MTTAKPSLALLAPPATGQETKNTGEKKQRVGREREGTRKELHSSQGSASAQSRVRTSLPLQEAVWSCPGDPLHGPLPRATALLPDSSLDALARNSCHSYSFCDQFKSPSLPDHPSYIPTSSVAANHQQHEQTAALPTRNLTAAIHPSLFSALE